MICQRRSHGPVDLLPLSGSQTSEVLCLPPPLAPVSSLDDALDTTVATRTLDANELLARLKAVPPGKLTAQLLETVRLVSVERRDPPEIDICELLLDLPPRFLLQ